MRLRLLESFSNDHPNCISNSFPDSVLKYSNEMGYVLLTGNDTAGRFWESSRILLT